MHSMKNTIRLMPNNNMNCCMSMWAICMPKFPTGG